MNKSAILLFVLSVYFIINISPYSTFVHTAKEYLKVDETIDEDPKQVDEGVSIEYRRRRWMDEYGTKRCICNHLVKDIPSTLVLVSVLLQMLFFR